MTEVAVLTGDVLGFGADYDAAVQVCDELWARYHAEEIAARSLPAASLLDNGGVWITRAYMGPVLYKGRWFVRIDARITVMQDAGVLLPTVADLDAATDVIDRGKRAVGAVAGVDLVRPESIDQSGKFAIEDAVVGDDGEFVTEDGEIVRK